MTLLSIRRLAGRLLLGTAVLGVLAGAAGAATFQDGYTIGSGLLGTDLIVDAADHAGLGGGDLRANDTGNGAGSYGFAVVYEDAWDIGTQVEITGIALPLRNPNSGTANNTSNGTFTFSFYELSGGTDPNGWDGIDNGEVVLATRDVEYTLAGVQDSAYFFGQTVPWALFDTPITYTAASTGFAVSVDSTGSIRTRNDPGPEGIDGRQANLFNGNQPGAGHQWTIAGTPMFVPPPPPPPTLLERRFDAAADTPGDAFWNAELPSFERFNFGADTSPVPVNDPAVPGITQAYEVGGSGVSNIFESTVNGQQAGRQDATFEIWFRPDDLTGGDQIIYEFGGAGSGGYFSLQGDQLSFYVNGAFSDRTLSTTLTDAEWTQVVGVINNTFDPVNASQDDFISLYVNGQFVGDTQANLADFNDWAGGNQAGLGQDGQSIANFGPIDNTMDDNLTVSFPFAGQIAIFEYTAAALTSPEIQDLFDAVTTAPEGLAGDYNGDGMVDGADYAFFRNNLGQDASVLSDGSRDPNATGVIGAADLAFLLQNFGMSNQPGTIAAAPEPSAAVLLAIASACCLRSRRR
ncbi:MAG: LamG-like jellyroll fold domain-containing protein [Planctomycetota bacterium]